ncbi:DUF3789 domain-containing protein [Desulfosporosinus lacus]
MNLLGTFLLGTLAGGFLGVMVMCLLQISRKDGET